MYDPFSLSDFQMPEGFLWGCGYAGHQVEGNNVNCQWYELEQAGKTEEKSGIACDSYQLYREDAELVKALGQQAFRTSVEWSRIEPEEGVFCEEAIEHYVDFFRRLHESGVKVFATMIHATWPIWFDRLGGFTKPEQNLHYFERYLRTIVPKIAPYVSFWNVLNEFNICRKEVKLGCLRFHALGYQVIHEYSDKPVSSAHALMDYIPRRPYDPFDQVISSMEDWKGNGFFLHAIRTGEVVYPYTDGVYLPEVKGSCDYWSVNYYVREMEDARQKEPECARYRHKVLKMTDMDFYLEEMHPEGMTGALLRLKDLPIYITENGCSCDDDDFRIVFLSLYWSAIREAMDLGADVRGYLQWSFLDNYEWTSFKPKFGMVGVNRETMERTVKPSAYFYRDCIAANGFRQEILRKYLKKIPTLAK